MMRVVLLCMVVPWAGGLAAQSDGFDFFERKIRPVLVERCYQCHSAESEKLKAELRLDTAEGIRKGGKSGKPAIVPHDAAASVLLTAISYTNADLQMPPKKQLPANVLEDFVAWVNMGAPDPRTNGALAIVRTIDHWAFKPVKAPKLPEVKDKSWPRNEIDYFILQKLEEKGLRPAPDADEHTLIRRAYFTLHGLPPNQAQQWPGLIDQLLASPRYGERWGRHWLDVARYSDTKGYVYSDREEPRFVYSHTYRDWVIEALNRDLPYDQFLELQIAADQMNCDRKDLAAMGFLTLGRRFLGVVHDIIDDRIDVLTRGTQGLTVSCARCHDHKFDPISTQDYYSLYGVFQASTESIVPIGSTESRPTESYERELRKRSQEVTNAFEKTKEDLANHLRKKTTDYLRAQKTAHLLPSEEFYEILGPDELNPVFVRQWQYYIQQRPKDDAIFGAWHRQGKTAETDNPLVREALAKATTMDDVARAYGELFVRIHKKWQDTKKVDPDEEPLRQVLYDEDGPVYPPKGSYVDQQFFFDEGGRVKLAKLLRDIDVLNITHPMALPHAGILEDKPEIHNPRVFKRGNPVNRGEEVPRQYLELVSGKQRKPFTRGSGRLEMAEIIARADNPLTARVLVNRVWHLHFGAGLVKSTSDFGTRADPPSHPELLDYLARRFVQEGWSIKKLHRLILSSRAWQQSSEAGAGGTAPSQTSGREDVALPAPASIDPENRLLSHMNRQRLDFEAMHDFMLAASGELNCKMGGRGVKLFSRPAARERAVYGYIDRQFLPSVYRTFDFANPDLHTPLRHLTSVPQQSLFFMNSPFVVERAQALTAELGEGEAAVRQLYSRLFQRTPSEREIQRGLEFVKGVEPPPPPPTNPPPAWQYGVGEIDESGALQSFTPFPHFTGDTWQGSEFHPDPRLGPAQLKADAGYPGDDNKHAVVRRWIAPSNCVLRISGTLAHEAKEGDGIRAYIVIGSKRPVASWTLRAQKAETTIEDVSVKAGETIDFVVACGKDSANDTFKWAPKVGSWDAKTEFAGLPEPPLKPLDAWAAFAQVLFFSNEFMFID
jgi:hypothetical protein